MKLTFRVLAFSALVLLVTACTQDPADVSYRDDEFRQRVHEPGAR